MSKSFKKTPIVKDNKGGRKTAKRFANKKVRKTYAIPNGKAYRKVYNTWDIYDYVCYCTLRNYLDKSSSKSVHKQTQTWRRKFYSK